ncbi:MAG TPA: hypothetical protein VNP73_10080 [Actinomycetota bacterium]|nr:hypothetical protein [Actinomycetota bacterium]
MAHVTMQDVSTMVRPARARFPWRGLLMGALAVTAAAGIAWAAVPRPASSDPDLTAVRTQAAAATEAVARLEAQVADLKADLRALDRSGDRTGARLGKATTALWGSLDRLRTSLKDQRGATSAANQEALAALERAESAARNLSVLEDRFEYHLRSDHGGG